MNTYTKKTAEEIRDRKRVWAATYRAKNKAKLKETSRRYWTSEKAKATRKRAYDTNVHFAYTNGGDWRVALLRFAKDRSKRYSRAFALTAGDLDVLWAKQNGKCAWLHVPMTMIRRSPWLVTIDRIDNAKGYIPSNVQLASRFANVARMGHSMEAFAEILRMAVGHLWIKAAA